MFKENYTSAMEKISASEAWKQSTLAAMHTAESKPDAPRTERPHAAAFAASTRRFSRKLLLTAAAVMLLALPAAYFLFAAGGLGGFEAKLIAPQAAPGEQDAQPQVAAGTGGEQGESATAGAASRAAVAADEAAPQEAASPEAASPEAAPQEAAPELTAKTAALSGHIGQEAGSVAPEQDKATAALLDGKGYFAGADAPGGYPTEGLTVLACTRLSADDAENPFGVEMYRFFVLYDQQDTAPSLQDKRLRADAELWVHADTAQ